MKMISILVKFVLNVAVLEMGISFVTICLTDGLKKAITSLPRLITDSLLLRLPRLIVNIAKRLLLGLAKLVLSVFDVGLTLAWTIVPGLAEVFPQPRLSSLVPMSPFIK